MKIPGYGRLAQAASKKIARANLNDFKKNFDVSILNLTNSQLPFNVISMSGSKSFWDQLYSIFTFFKNAGKPYSWTIYSDGSYTSEQIKQFEAIPNIKVRNLDWEKITIQKEFVRQYPLIKKLEIFSNHPIQGTTIFADSDILFYKGFCNYAGCFSKNNWHLADIDHFYFDKEYIEQKLPRMFSVNTGFLVLNQKPNWDVAKNYVKKRISDGLSIGHWSEQTAINIMIQNDPSFRVLNPADFVISEKDGFKLGVDFDYNKIALRHFVTPVRHKMWQTNWRKIIS